MENRLTKYRFARRSVVLGKSVFDHVPDTIPLGSGAAYPPCLPDVVQEATEAVGPLRDEAMQYAPLMGLKDLREEVCEFVAQDGVRATRENVLITYGAKHAFDLALRVFCEPGDAVIVTRPTYMTSLHIMRTHNVRFIEVGQDAEGLKTEDLERKLQSIERNGEAKPKLLFDVPDFHNPTGITTSLERRLRMIELAQVHDFVICEDDPYRRIRFEGEVVPSIKSMDMTGRVVGLGTVSKILAPGLRVGWAIGDSSVVRRMAMQKADGGSNAFAQRIVVQLMRSGKVTLHIDEISQQMRLHRDVMVQALAARLPEARVNVPKGGYFLWVEFPKGTNCEKLVELGIDEGVEVTPGRLSFSTDDPGNFIRMAYSFASVEQIKEGVSMISAAWRNLRHSV